LIEVEDRSAKASLSKDTYERVRRTLDDALAELELAEPLNNRQAARQGLAATPRFAR
jgi:hypothetical protein